MRHASDTGMSTSCHTHRTYGRPRVSLGWRAAGCTVRIPLIAINEINRQKLIVIVYKHGKCSPIILDEVCVHIEERKVTLLESLGAHRKWYIMSAS